ncbi:efflux RND transporter periplasmic adaptor subunit [Yoonia vestfoldensis]|uniref:Multidrug resistance protein MdtA n=1 Tax=Yoonia vestfoldensis TaxID=245188 RepID=A0A1Y0EEH1_9RHOB|nr:HlyD family efflux transporter periplasmic adaptor subunit [Yoonia vestfoldensis]ARU01838.1 multidrug resistance protein MdtA [Yoonia vestfoldensis]
MRLAPLLVLPPIALGIAAAVWMIASAPGPAQVGGDALALPVRVMTVAAEDIRPTATAWGNLRAAETWVAVAEVQGEVIWRHPDREPGHLIPAGTEVLRIDPADYELALAQSLADLAALEAERAQLSAEAANTGRILELERARLALAEADLERTRTLVAQGAVPQSRADEAERATLLARRTVAELENTLALIPSREAQIAAQVARSEAAIDRARRSLDRTTLTTPFDLRVTEVHAELFQTVAPGQVVIRADGIAAAEVVAHLPIDSFRRLLGDTPEGITLGDMMRDMPATQIEVTLSPLADPRQIWSARVVGIEGALDARARTVPVVVRVDDPYEGADPPRRLPLVPNMQVQLSFSGASISGLIAIPEAALHGGMVHIASADDRLELRPVTAGFARDGSVVITEGLVSGDRVVIDDIAPAIPGMALTPVEAPQ